MRGCVGACSGCVRFPILKTDRFGSFLCCGVRNIGTGGFRDRGDVVDCVVTFGFVDLETLLNRGSDAFLEGVFVVGCLFEELLNEDTAGFLAGVVEVDCFVERRVSGFVTLERRNCLGPLVDDFVEVASLEDFGADL